MIKSSLLLKNVSNVPVYEPWLNRWVEPDEKVFIQSNGSVAIQHPDLDDVSDMSGEDEESHTQTRRAEIKLRNDAANVTPESVAQERKGPAGTDAAPQTPAPAAPAAEAPKAPEPPKGTQG